MIRFAPSRRIPTWNRNASAKMQSIRKLVCKPKIDDWSPLSKFYYADEALNQVASELDSFDGRKDPERCSQLISKLRHCQDRVLHIIEEMMADNFPLGSERASRDYRVKFPDDILHDSLAGQLWFGAECLAAGSNIIDHEVESDLIRPIARSFTSQLDSLRSILNDQGLRDPKCYPDKIRHALLSFDHIFAEFELRYVSAMVPVKTVKEYDLQLDVTVLFSETLIRAIERDWINDDQIEMCDPTVMITLPRLAIVCGLLSFPHGPLNVNRVPEDIPEMFRPFRSLLRKIRDLLATLAPSELQLLEKSLCSQNDNILSNEKVTLIADFDKKDSSASEEHTTNDSEQDTGPICRCTNNNADEPEIVSSRNTANSSSGASDSPVIMVSATQSPIHMSRPNDMHPAPGTTDHYDHDATTTDVSSLPPGFISDLLTSPHTGTRPTDELHGNSEGWHCPTSTTVIKDCRNCTVLNADDESVTMEHVRDQHCLEAMVCTPICTAPPQIPPHMSYQVQQEQRHQRYLHQNSGTSNITAQSQNALQDNYNNPNNSQSNRCFPNPGDPTGIRNETSQSTVITDFSPTPVRHGEDTSFSNNNSRVGDDNVCHLCGCMKQVTKTEGKINEEDKSTNIAQDKSSVPPSCDAPVNAGEVNQQRSSIHQRRRKSKTEKHLRSLSPASRQLRGKFASPEDLIHRLFVCIAGVADQLQSNYPSDLRAVLKTVLQPQETLSVFEVPGAESTTSNIVGGEEEGVEVRESPTEEHDVAIGVPWVPDNECDACVTCRDPFTLLRRRHHCRNCGQIFCGNCSANNIPLPELGYGTRPVRVCNHCFLFKVNAFVESPSASTTDNDNNNNSSSNIAVASSTGSSGDGSDSAAERHDSFHEATIPTAATDPNNNTSYTDTVPNADDVYDTLSDCGGNHYNIDQAVGFYGGTNFEAPDGNAVFPPNLLRHPPGPTPSTVPGPSSGIFNGEGSY